MNIPASARRLVLLLPVTVLVVLGHHALAQQLVPLWSRLPALAATRFALLASSFLVHAVTALWVLPMALRLLHGAVAAEVVRRAAWLALAVVFARTGCTVVAPQPLQAPWLLLAVGVTALAGLVTSEPRQHGLRALPPIRGPLPQPLRVRRAG